MAAQEQAPMASQEQAPSSIPPGDPTAGGSQATETAPASNLLTTPSVGGPVVQPLGPSFLSAAPATAGPSGDASVVGVDTPSEVGARRVRTVDVRAGTGVAVTAISSAPATAVDDRPGAPDTPPSTTEALSGAGGAAVAPAPLALPPAGRRVTFPGWAVALAAAGVGVLSAVLLARRGSRRRAG